MASEQSLPALLSKLTTSLESASKAVPQTVAPPDDGISLLDVKNELFLSYLQNLAFLILVKLRNKNGVSSDDEDAVVRRLVELRIYLEKGVRPLEGKLKYQIDKVVRAADDAARTAHHRSTSKPSKADTNSDEHSSAGEEAENDSASDNEANELSYRPNPSAFTTRPTPSTPHTPYGKSTPTNPSTSTLYRPPRITATTMPTTTSSTSTSHPAKPTKPLRAHAIDDYITTELSTAPTAQPSIGSTITHGGRRTTTDAERRAAAERRAYEETNYVRLAPAKTARGARAARQSAGWGAEELELRGLGAGAERVARAVGRKRGAGREAEGDGQRGSGFGGEVSFGGGKRRRVGGGR